MKTWQKLEKIYGQIYEAKIDQIPNIWFEFFKVYLKSLGFNLKAIKALFEWGESGHNWQKLHPSNEIEKASPNVIRNQFQNEVFYIYDRMSLDRLFRAHWLYNVLQQKLNEKK